MTGAFFQGGPQDLQRHPQWGSPKGSVVPAFVGSASYHLGQVTRFAGLPVEWSERSGGIPNWVNGRILNPTAPRLDIKSKIDTSGPYGLSAQNYDNIVKASLTRV